MRRNEAVLLGTASAVSLAGCALVGLGVAETGTTQDLWTNVWFDLGLPLLILAIAMGVHAVAMVHRRTLPPSGSGDNSVLLGKSAIWHWRAPAASATASPASYDHSCDVWVAPWPEQDS